SPDPNGAPGNMNDILHPNDLGFNKMAGKWFTQINSIVKGCEENIISSWSCDNSQSNIIIDRMGINDIDCSDCTINEEGMKGEALLFNGSNELIITNSNTLNFNLNGSFSVELWMQTEQSGSGNKVFIGKYNGPGESAWWLGMDAQTGKAKFNVRSSQGNDNIVAESTTIVNDGKWHHIFGVKDVRSGSLKIYIDGVQEDEENTSYTGSFIGDADLSIGAYIGAFNFIGNLDEISIYDKSLKSSDIINIHNKGRMKLTDCNESVIDLNVKVFVEGGYNSINNELDVNTGSIPIYQPFMNSNLNYNGPEYVISIPNSNIADWILVSLRSDTNASSIIERRAAFLKKDGSIVDLDGISQLQFPIDPGEYYIVIEHRNHLPIMSATKIVFQ
ncbi:MAG: LamG domain-containing protein, partial [Melioribacteraceae bacterium]|nr:LamG domain-containing protein [Melioribacteraceae bacterium]